MRGSHKDQVCVMAVPLQAIEIKSLQVHQTQQLPECVLCFVQQEGMVYDGGYLLLETPCSENS